MDMDKLDNENFERSINKMDRLIEFHGYNKCLLLKLNMEYANDSIYFETQPNEHLVDLNTRHLAVELTDMMYGNKRVLIDNIESDLLKLFDKYLN